MLKAFASGAFVAALCVIGTMYLYFALGIAPAATADPSMPFEKKMASKALHAHIDRAGVPESPIPADEANLLAGAKIYKEQCAMCHGLPDQPSPAIAESMFPHATLMFKGKGVTHDSPQESYWKIANGIRLTGMPSFKGSLQDQQLWQLSLLVARANRLPDSARKWLAATQPSTALAGEAPLNLEVSASKKR